MINVFHAPHIDSVIVGGVAAALHGVLALHFPSTSFQSRARFVLGYRRSLAVSRRTAAVPEPLERIRDVEQVRRWH
jgi:hypothetical protein